MRGRTVGEAGDTRGLYAKSRAGRLPNFTGIDSPYEEPAEPELLIDTASGDPEALADAVIVLLESRGIVARTASKTG